MKALSLWQPWAYAACAGIKKYETRSWSTKHRGPLLIHAAKTFPKVAREFAETERALGRLPSRLCFGAIIGKVYVLGNGSTEYLLSTGEISPIERLYGDYSPGRWGWMLTDPVLFNEPIPYRGQQGFFDVPDELLPAASFAVKEGL